MSVEKGRPTTVPHTIVPHQRQEAGAKAGPVPMTQRDIEAMAAGGPEAQALAARLFASGGIPPKPRPRDLPAEAAAGKAAPNRTPPQD
jgi:hypothetical protein